MTYDDVLAQCHDPIVASTYFVHGRGFVCKSEDDCTEAVRLNPNLIPAYTPESE